MRKPANDKWEYLAAFDGGQSDKWRIDVLLHRNKKKLWMFWDRKGLNMKPGDAFWTVDSLTRCVAGYRIQASSIDNTKNLSKDLAEKLAHLLPLFGVRNWLALKWRVRKYQEKINE